MCEWLHKNKTQFSFRISNIKKGEKNLMKIPRKQKKVEHIYMEILPLCIRLQPTDRRTQCIKATL